MMGLQYEVSELSSLHFFGNVSVYPFNLLIGWAGLVELIPFICIFQITPECRHFLWNLKIPVFLCSHLQSSPDTAIVTLALKEANTYKYIF